MASASRYGPGLVGLFKRGWNEIPEVISTTGLALIGVAMALYGLHLAEKKENIRTYRYQYTVYRDDDPKVEQLRSKDHPLN